MIFLNGHGCSIKLLNSWMFAALVPQADFDCSLHINCLYFSQYVPFLYFASWEKAKDRQKLMPSLTMWMEGYKHSLLMAACLFENNLRKCLIVFQVLCKSFSPLFMSLGCLNAWEQPVSSSLKYNLTRYSIYITCHLPCASHFLERLLRSSQDL